MFYLPSLSTDRPHHRGDPNSHSDSGGLGYIDALKHGLGLDIGDSRPLFKRAVPLHMTVIFCMPRPASHFKTHVRSSANLKPKYEAEHDHIGIRIWTT
jgi:hypothetical protein